MTLSIFAAGLVLGLVFGVWLGDVWLELDTSEQALAHEMDGGGHP